MVIKCNIDQYYNRTIIYEPSNESDKRTIKSTFIIDNLDIHQSLEAIHSDLHNISTFIYAIDKAVKRSNAEDGWTRELNVELPVSDYGKWIKVNGLLEKCLSFLSGDKWTISFIKNELSKMDSILPPEKKYDTVCLLSGGLDSYIGAIDLLEQNQKVLFLSYYGKGKATKPPQEFVKNVLIDHYKIDENDFINFKLNTDLNKESSTRTRSFLFFTHAIILKQYAKTVKQVIVPENGFISLNIPLTNSRIGSSSTRTTHPYYFILLNELSKQLGLNVEVINPYKFKTKGEMMRECLNKTLLDQTYQGTVSCSNSSRVKCSHCGVCLPCIIRRAAIEVFSRRDKTIYQTINISDTNAGNTMLNAIKMFESSLDSSILSIKIQENGPVRTDKEMFTDLFNRGYTEMLRVVKEI